MNGKRLNPECISSGISTQLVQSSCTGCGKCLSVCQHGGHIFTEAGHEINRMSCIGCGECAYYCPATAISIIGKSYTPEELLKEILKDRMYFETVPFSSFEMVLPYTDLFLYDIKLWDEEKHRLATGVSNQLILENLKKLTTRKKHEKTKKILFGRDVLW